MDRDKKDKLPNMQVGFIDSICMPVYQVCISKSFYRQYFKLLLISFES